MMSLCDDHRRAIGLASTSRRTAYLCPWYAALALGVGDISAILRVFWGYPGGFDWRLDALNGLMNLGAYGGMILAVVVGMRSLWSGHWRWALGLPLLWIASFCVCYWLDAGSGRVTRGFLYTDPAIVGHGQLLSALGCVVSTGGGLIRCIVGIVQHVWQRGLRNTHDE